MKKEIVLYEKKRGVVMTEEEKAFCKSCTEFKNYSSFDEMKFPDGVNFCIKCKNADTVVKNGKRNGRQRYKCKECNATFTATTDTVMLNTRKTSDVWEEFIWCMLQKYSMRKAAVHRNIAFMWRHKILNILRLTDDTKLSGIIEADETYIRRSCKGNHSKDKNFKFPNGRTQARKRGYGNHTRTFKRNGLRSRYGVAGQTESRWKKN